MSSDRERLHFLDAQNCLRLQDYLSLRPRDDLLEVQFGDPSAGRRVTLITLVHREEHRPGQPERREELDPLLANKFYECGLAGKAICTGPMPYDYAMPPAAQIAEAMRLVTS